MRGGVYDGYNQGLVFSEPHTGTIEEGTLTILDAEIKNGFGGYFSDENTKYDVKYSFNPVFKDVNNNPIPNVPVTINDNFGNEIFSGTADDVGALFFELTHTSVSSTGNIDYTHYDINVTFSGTVVTRRYQAGKTFVDFPFYVVSEETGNADILQIEALVNNLQDNLHKKEDETATSLANVE